MRWLRWGLGALAALFIIPILEVGCVRFANPPLTPLMLLRQMESRPSSSAAPERRFEWVALEAMPPVFLQCVLFSEDQRFFEHRGFDWKEIHAARKRAGSRPIRGASTITMQCARSLFLWQGRSWVRKGLEAYYTFWMETCLSKRRILELYANVIELGDGIYGIEAAAQAHYEMQARQLSREQCAMMAALLPSPRSRRPDHPDSSLVMRQARILRHAKSTPSLDRVLSEAASKTSAPK